MASFLAFLTASEPKGKNEQPEVKRLIRRVYSSISERQRKRMRKAGLSPGVFLLLPVRGVWLLKQRPKFLDGCCGVISAKHRAFGESKLLSGLQAVY